MSYSSEVLADSPLWYASLDDATGYAIAAITASSYYPANPPSCAHDGSLTNPWITNGTQSGWLTYQLSTAWVATGYDIWGGAAGASTRDPKSWTFEGSNDGSSWTVLDTRTNQAWSQPSTLNKYTFANTTAYLYYRLNVSANNGDAYLAVAEMMLASTLADSSGNGHAMASHALTGTTGKLGIAAQGRTGYTVPAGILPGASWMNPSTWTVEAWVNRGTGNGGRILTREAGPGQTVATDYVWSLRLSSSGTLNCPQIVVFRSGSAQFLTSATPVSASSWYHLAATWDGTTLTLYVNGTSVGTLTPGGPISASAATDMILLNAEDTGGTSFTYGVPTQAVDEAAFYGTALSASRILAHYNAGTAPPVPTTTVAAPVSAGLGFAASTVLTTTVAAAVSAGLAFAAVPVTTVATPVAVGMSFAAVQAGTTTVGAPVTGGLGFAAQTVLTSTLAAPVSVGLSFDGSKWEPTTVAAPVTVGLAFDAVVGGTTTVGLPASVGLSFVASGGDTRIPGWTAEQSQAALLDIEPVGGPLLVEPAIMAAPAWVTERMIRRQSHQMPAMVPDAAGKLHSTGTYTIVDGDVGVPHLFVSNRDVTYFRNVPVVISEWSSSLPGGDDVAGVEFPQLTFGDVPGVGDLTWLRNDAPAEIYLIDPSGHRIQPPMFCGNLVSDNVGHTETDLTNGWHLEGAMSQANYQGHRMPTFLTATDIGALIAKHLNEVVSRRYAPLKPVNTAIMTRDRGSYSDTEWGYVHNLLGTAWTMDGHQWSILRGTAPRSFKIALKDTSTVHWTVTAGAPGVEVNLTADQASVVHAIYGQGVDSDGYSWAGWCYPNLHNDTAPAYPYASAGTTMSIGSTDAGTLTGHGVSDWQERARQLGFRIATDGVYSSDDAATCREIQARDGLLVDGIVGPQTWAATWAVGSNAGSLDGAYRRPLAILPAVDPHLYAADGAITGPNPAYQPKIIRREIDVDYGPGVTKAEAMKSAAQQLARDGSPGWVGTLILKSDPHEGSRFQVVEGQNITLWGFRGGDQLLHVVDTRKQLDGEMPATFTVDSKARDAMTVSAILSRDRTTNADPLRRKRHQSRSSRVEMDTVVPFDGESGAGVIPRMALFGGLWSVVRIPVSQVGTIAKIDVSTSSPATPFAFALFGAPIQPSHLVRYVGNPLTSSGPFTTHAGNLEDDFGFIEGWGQSGQAAGYYPGSQSNGPLTGRLYETPGGLIYRSLIPPWVWVAMYAQSSCFISGRIYPSPVA